MTLTMVIADDEPLVRKSLELFITKEFPDIKIVGIGENGIELKELLEQFSPDLAMVDIRMPGLTGIEVIELMRAKGIRTHFIINTAYSDFDYVKRALDLKTDAYLLKPSKKEEMLRVVSELCRMVRQEKEKERTQSDLKTAISTVSPYLGSDIMRSLLAGKCDETNFAVYTRLNEIEFSGGCIVTCMFREAVQIRYEELNAELEAALDGICDFLALAEEKSILVMLFIQQELAPEKQEAWSRELSELIAKTLEERLGQACIYGLGGIYTAFPQMQQSYRDSLRQIAEKEARSGHKPEFTADAADKVDSYVEAAKAYIEQNYTSDISLLDCAAHVQISLYYLSHIFKEKTGRNFVEYLTELRIRRAKELAGNPGYTVSEIAERCGYLNTTYFCKVFKRHVGETIGQYRKRHAPED